MLLVGADTVALAKTNDTTFTGTLSTEVSGVLTPVLVLGAVRTTLTAITIYGFAESTNYVAPLAGDVITLQHAGHAYLAGVRAPQGLVIIDLDSHSVSQVDSPGANAAMYYVGRTYIDSIFLVRSAGGLESWTLFPAPTRVAVHPDITAFGSSNYDAARLGPNVWLRAPHNSYFVYGRADTTMAWGLVGDFVTVTAVDLSDVVLSPRHDRATMVVEGSSATGARVFDMSTGLIAYSVAQLSTVSGAAFSADGALLALTGGPYLTASPHRIMVFNSTTGAVLADTTIAGNVFSVAFDPTRPVLYVGSETSDRRPLVYVMDRASLRVLGRMSAPSTTGTCVLPGGDNCYFQHMVLDAQNQLFVAATWQSAAAWRFTLPPGNTVPGLSKAH